MTEFDSSQNPVVYRAISNKGAVEIANMAFFRRPDEDGLSVLLSAKCSAGVCEANKCLGLRRCYGEYALSSEKIEKLGLKIKLDSPDAENYSENHAEILGVPIHDGDTLQEAEMWAAMLCETEPVPRLANPVFKQRK